MTKALQAYELFRKAHQFIKEAYLLGEDNEILDNAITAVDSVLYMAESVAVRISDGA